MIINKSYVYALKPNKKQIQAIEEIFQQTTILHNLYMEDKDKFIGYHTPNSLLKKYLSKNETLQQTDPLALINVLYQLTSNSSNPNKIRTSNKTSYTTSFRSKQGFRLVDKNHIYLPKVGNVKIKIHRSFPTYFVLKSITVSRKANRYYGSILFSFRIDLTNMPIDENKIIGLDYSATHFYVDSFGNKANFNHFLRDNYKQLKFESKKLSHMQANSSNYNKQKLKIEKIHQKITNKRKDTLQKLSTQLLKEYDLICIEKLDLNELKQKRNIVKSTIDNAYNQFVTDLKYKAKEKEKQVIEISPWYPSSKTCYYCGYHYSNLSIQERSWTCPNCKRELDRDQNAALNIAKEGKRIYKSRRAYGASLCNAQEIQR